MKKMKFVKIACAVLTMCLITTCAIGTTLAKYTTGSSASDTARVAKWGVEVSTSGTMFGKAYGANGAGEFADTIMAETSASVNTAVFGGDKVVAPGTKNEVGIEVRIKGQPEVAFDLSATAQSSITEIFLGVNTYGVMVETLVNAATDFIAEGIYYKVGDDYLPATLGYYVANTGATYYKLTDMIKVTEKYYPIVWTGKITATDTNGIGSGEATYTTLAAATEALVGGINAIANFEANDNVDLVYKLTWAWNIDNGAKNGDDDYSNKCDTILGNLQAGVEVVKLSGQNYIPVETSDYNLVITSGFEVRATQID